MDSRRIPELSYKYKTGRRRDLVGGKTGVTSYEILNFNSIVLLEQIRPHNSNDVYGNNYDTLCFFF